MPIVRIPLGRRVFAPLWGMTLLAAAICALFVYLGLWQWNKGVRREAEWAAFARGADAPVALGSRRLSDLTRFKHIEFAGHFEGAHQFLLDNTIHEGYDGYYVVTPFKVADGRVLLVNRGWVPFTGSRSRLPDVSLAVASQVTLTGRVGRLPAHGLAFGEAPPHAGSRWPKVTSFPTIPELAAALGEKVETGVVLLDPKAPYGYVRDWSPPGMKPIKNLFYGIQWWSFAAALFIIWAVLSAPKQRQRAMSEAH